MSRLTSRFVTANVTDQIAKIPRQTRRCHGVTDKNPWRGLPSGSTRNSKFENQNPFQHLRSFAVIRGSSRLFAVRIPSFNDLTLLTFQQAGGIPAFHQTSHRLISTYFDLLRAITSKFDLQFGGASLWIAARGHALPGNPESGIQYQASLLPSRVDPLEIACNSPSFTDQNPTVSPPISTELTPISTKGFTPSD
jgi:hypothetical protein